MFDTFGSKVKIKSSTETDSKGLAGKIGDVYGHTTPSIINLEVIGTPKEDYAVNVYFHDLNTSYWFDVDLLEEIDDGQGTQITLDGINKKWIKGQNGWIEEDLPNIINLNPEFKRNWWEFWKN
jgi:hypothetical protein